MNGVLGAQRPSLGEAHGGYTFCALASWVLLQPYIPLTAEDSDAPRVDVRRLLRWLVYMQGSEIELGGFKGRTNKLVDGCYSWWVGGAFALLEALGMSPSIPAPAPTHEDETTSHASAPAENGWDDADGALYSAADLLSACSWQSQIRFSTSKPCKSIFSLLGSIQRGASATSRRSMFDQFEKPHSHVFMPHAGTLTHTIPHTASRACRLHSTMCTPLPHEGRKCVLPGKAKRVSV